MKRAVFIILILFLYLNTTGCGKKKDTDEFQEPLTLEELTAIPLVSNPEPEPQKQTQDAPAPGLEPLPPGGPYKPSVREIQTALNNAKFYVGKIDGKIGPITEKAIRQFQESRNLKVDGIVGKKTWDALSKYLDNPVDD